MRLPNNRNYPLLKGLMVLTCTGLLAGCGGSGAGLTSVAALPENGPQADYPVLVGDAYQVAGETFTPSDTMNYDEVGYLAAESSGVGITGAHHTLPVPSYVEVTSLTTGRTILARLERRGPMNSTHLLALSPAAMAQLQADAETPVRVRRVNPPEAHRAMLRGGSSAPLRMDTPMSLVNVLKRQLPEHIAPPPTTTAPIETAQNEPASSTQDVAPSDVAVGNTSGDLSEPASVPRGIERVEIESGVPAWEPPDPWADSTDEAENEFADAFADESSSAAVEVATVPAPVSAQRPPVDEGFVVQAAAFSTADRAERVAGALGGVVTQSGRFYRVRTGPFVSRSEAEASLANVKAAGYSDARILTSG